MKRYLFVDYATQGYSAVVAALILCFHDSTVPYWAWLLAAHGLGLALTDGLIRTHARHPASKLLDFLRHFYPILLYAAFFCETGALNRLFFSHYLDPVVIGWEQALFGCQPSVLFMARFPYLALSEVFYAAYFSYYPMIAGVGLALFLRNRQWFFHYVSVISFVFYVCYLLYIFLPVIGPPAFFHTYPGFRLNPALEQLAGANPYPPTVETGLFFRLVEWIWSVFEAPGSAIPSSHVAVAIATAWFSFRYLRPIRWYHLGAVVLLCLATVYCRYHYGVDVLAGALTAAVLIPLGNWLYFKGFPASQAQVLSVAPDAPAR